MHGYGGMGFGFMFFQFFIFIAIFIVIWWLLRDGLQKTQFTKRESTPLLILKKRLAKGEITIKEFEKLKKEIE